MVPVAAPGMDPSMGHPFTIASQGWMYVAEPHVEALLRQGYSSERQGSGQRPVVNHVPITTEKSATQAHRGVVGALRGTSCHITVGTLRRCLASSRHQLVECRPAPATGQGAALLHPNHLGSGRASVHRLAQDAPFGRLRAVIYLVAEVNSVERVIGAAALHPQYDMMGTEL